MGRIHSFEFGDQKWVPSFIRSAMTEFLSFLSNKTDAYKKAIPILRKGIEKVNGKVVDLGSGSGGGWPSIVKHLDQENVKYHITLTDIHPDIASFKIHEKSSDGKINFHLTPVDAMNVPKELRGMRTMFLSLHHFKPDEVKAILKNAVESGQPFAMFEGQARNPGSILAMIFSPITVLFVTPFIRPFKIERIIFTYLIPVIPILVMWDGIISALRTYSEKELKEITSAKEFESYHWEIGKTGSIPPGILFMLGIPKE